MEEDIKINFFKKIWYSIAKPSKYANLRKLGLGKAIKYIFSIISIFALILSILATILQINTVNDAISYLDKNLPDIKFKDNNLSLDNAEATILDDEKIIGYIGNKIVINPLIDKNKAIDQYRDLATEKNKVLVFLSEEYLLISNKYNPENGNEEGIESKKYSEVSSNFISDSSYEYSKKDVIEYLKERTTYTYYIAQYFIIYFGMITFVYGIYIIFISLSLWLVTKLSKFKWSIKESVMNTIYASTLSIFAYVLYSVMNYYIKFKFLRVDVICIGLIFIYLYILVWIQKNKKDIQENEMKKN